VWILLRVGLDGRGDATIRVALSQNWVDRTSKNGGIPRLNLTLFVILGLMGVDGYVVSLGAELLDAGLQLRDRGGNVGELDDVGLGRFADLAQEGEIVRNSLLFLEFFREGAQDTPSDGDVARNNTHVSEGTELEKAIDASFERKEGVIGMRTLVRCVRINPKIRLGEIDLGLLMPHKDIRRNIQQHNKYVM